MFFYYPFKVHCSADNDNATKATKSCCKKLKICWAHSVNLHTAGNRTKSNTCFGLSSVLHGGDSCRECPALCLRYNPYFWSWVIYNVQFLWKIILPFVDLKSCKMCSLHEMLDLFISLKTDAYRDKSEQSYKVTGYRCTRLPLMCFSFFFYGNKRDCSWSTCVHSVQY